MGIHAIVPWVWWTVLGLAGINWGHFVYTLRSEHGQCMSSADATGSRCTHLAHRPEVRWWGIPSWVWGGIYLGVLTGTGWIPFPERVWMQGVLTTLGVAVSVYLVGVLRRLRAHCTHCYIAHGLNVLLWLTALTGAGSVWLDR